MIRVSHRYAELAAATNFSFLRGASHPEEMVARAAELGLAGLGVADRNSLAGIVRAHVYARENSLALKLVVGARLVFRDGSPDVLAYPRDRAAYGRLCRLLTSGNLRAPKGQCWLDLDDLLAFGEGLHIIVLPRGKPGALAKLKEAFGERLWIGASPTYGADMRSALAKTAALARKLGAPLLALNDALMHVPERRPLADVLACIREGVTLEAAGRLTQANSERHLKSASEMMRLFAEAPEAVTESVRFLDGLSFSLDELAHVYPEELREGYETPQQALAAYAGAGARERYPGGVPETVAKALSHELALIQSLNYAPYFLTVHDIVRFARSKGILCQGRGSAANSAVCYCLGITEVDPSRFDLLFERFLSPDRNEPPDIDVDFEHERREEVIQYIYAKYGRERAGLASAVTTYRARSAIRETAKAFGLSEDVVVSLNSLSWGREDAAPAPAGLDLGDPNLALSLKMAQEISGFPRHLTQHSGGFVITRDRLDEVAPIMNTGMAERTAIEWDKNDLDALGLLKIDVLALGMLTALAKGFRLLDRHYGLSLRLSSVPPEEACVYAMIQRADTIGVFQIESRAQMSMLPRLKPAEFYDLVIEVAIVRPGPIQGDMVHPYLRRRQGLEPAVFPKPELEAVLGRTLGVPLFQEQAMKIAILAGFTPAEADKLRRAMATFRRVGTIQTFRDRMIAGLTAKGYERDFAERCFRQIEGFGEYGFPESHAASFALLVYASCWMKCRYPDAFLAAMLNSQPLGFYAPAQLVRDAREHGVEVREVDVNFSDWDAALEPLGRHCERSEAIHDSATPPHPDPPPQGGRESSPAPRLHRRHAEMAQHIRAVHAVRLGLRQIVGAREAEMRALVERRGGLYDSVRDLWLRGGVSLAGLEKLAGADAFRSLGLDRREALWAVKALNRVGDQDDLPLFAASRPERDSEPDADLPPMPLGAHVVEDYRRLSLSLKAHPIAFMRSRLTARGILRTDALDETKSGARVTVAGLVLVRQRPGTAKGVIFMTLEDEAGIANIIVWPKAFERLRALVIGARFVAVTGKLQSESGVIHVIAERMEDWTPTLGQLSDEGRSISTLNRADEVKHPQLSVAKKRQGNRFAQVQLFADPGGAVAAPPSPAPLAPELKRALPTGRNFH